MSGNPEAFGPVGNAPHNLVDGVGEHVGPDARRRPLQLRALTRSVLDVPAAIEPDPDRPRERKLPPVGGFAAAPLRLR